MKYKALNNGVRSIFKDYDSFVIDLWGVIHNGLILHQAAVEVLKNLKINQNLLVDLYEKTFVQIFLILNL